MKANRGTSEPAHRQIFVLTPEETKTVCFVLIAFLLGLATKCYRDNHRAASSKPAAAVREYGTPRASPISRSEVRTQPRPKL